MVRKLNFLGVAFSVVLIVALGIEFRGLRQDVSMGGKNLAFRPQEDGEDVGFELTERCESALH